MGCCVLSFKTDNLTEQGKEVDKLNQIIQEGGLQQKQEESTAVST